MSGNSAYVKDFTVTNGINFTGLLTQEHRQAVFKLHTCRKIQTCGCAHIILHLDQDKGGSKITVLSIIFPISQYFYLFIWSFTLLKKKSKMQSLVYKREGDG